MNSHEFKQLATNRYSCRSYSDQPVTRELLIEVIEAAHLAPSACNKQPWLFIIPNNDQERQAVVECYNREWIKTAPEFIIACGSNNEAWHRASDGKDHTDVDVSIAIEHICLAATAAGLGTCWVCNFDVKLLRTRFNIPDELTPIAIIPIGYPSEGNNIISKKRKPISEIIKWGKF
ncbi:MAG: nitroreductase family protein [Muribaculaceae bacterium]|nr:nitroreductase family protein [Muribaculaceae bacterium]